MGVHRLPVILADMPRELPLGDSIVASVIPITAIEGLSARDFVHLIDSGGVLSAELANAVDLTKPADGYVMEGMGVGGKGRAFATYGSIISGFVGLTRGAIYYLSATVGGGMTTVAPASTVNRVQRVGIALSTTDLLFIPANVPVNAGLATLTAIAGEALGSGTIALHLFNSGGVLKCEKANATDNTKPCNAYMVPVSHGITAGLAVTVYSIFGSLVDVSVTMTPTIGATYYLGTSDGDLVTTPPATTGNIKQPLFIGYSSTHLLYQPEGYGPNQGSDVASASTVTFGDAPFYNVTGTANIDNFAFSPTWNGRTVLVKFTGAATVVYTNHSILTPTLGNITVAANDIALIVCISSTIARFIPIGNASLNSPAFTGIPTAPTAAPGTNTTQVANTAFIQAAIAALINSAPGALDTLEELADALGDDANFAATMTTALAGKQPLDADLTAIAGLTPANDDFIQRKSGAWVNRTTAQVKSDLGVSNGDWTQVIDSASNINPSAADSGTDYRATNGGGTNLGLPPSAGCTAGVTRYRIQSPVQVNVNPDGTDVLECVHYSASGNFSSLTPISSNSPASFIAYMTVEIVYQGSGVWKIVGAMSFT